jgi:uncharacterized protein YggE
MRSSKMQLSLAGLAFAAVLLLPLSPAGAQTPPARTLSLAGNGEVHAVPDAALVSAGVVSEGDTAAAALKANSTALAKVVEVIHAAGVEGKDMQTSGLSLQARYYRPDKPSPTDRPRIIGYTAVNQVALRVRDLAKLGDLLDKVTIAGANRVDGIDFIVTNQEALLDEARRKAVADARDKADLYARTAGFMLGKVMSLLEESTPSPRPMARAAPSGYASMAAAPVPVEAGEMTLSMRVRVVWSLAD